MAQNCSLQTCCHQVNPAAAELVWSRDTARGSLSSLRLREQRLHCQVQATNKHRKLVTMHRVSTRQSLGKVINPFHRILYTVLYHQ